jgi:hypothetical protein
MHCAKNLVAYLFATRNIVSKCVDHLLMLIGFLALQGCVGAGFYAPSENYVYSRLMTPKASISLKHDHLDKGRVVSTDHRRRTATPYRTSDAMRDWGAPDRIIDEGGHDVWIYNGNKFTWMGAAIHVMATIPLAVPAGRDQYHLHFKDDALEYLAHRDTATYLFVCDPFYAFAHALGTAMSSTGGVSSVGSCSGIKRSGVYFHNIMNY